MRQLVKECIIRPVCRPCGTQIVYNMTGQRWKRWPLSKLAILFEVVAILAVILA